MFSIFLFETEYVNVYVGNTKFHIRALDGVDAVIKILEDQVIDNLKNSEKRFNRSLKT